MINIRISEVKMQKSDNHQMAKSTHRKVRASTTLNRKYVKRPSKSTDMVVAVKRSPKVERFSSASQPQKINVSKEKPVLEKAKSHPLQQMANEKMKARKLSVQAQKAQPKAKMSAKELKDQAIKKALASAAVAPSNQSSKKEASKMHFGLGRIVLALSCAAAAVFAIAYFVNLNMPDISLRVAAMHTGINASYPSYVPRDYSISSVTSENDKVTLSFSKATTGDTFSLIEEKSAWDSSALLSNFVKNVYGEDYIIVREQGITIYVSNSKASWVNGGILYKIEAENGTLNEKQIRSIAVSL